MIDYLPIVAGDILAVRGSGWFSDHIVAAAGGPCSHLGLFLNVDPPIVIQAEKRVTTDPLDLALAKCKRAWILHDKSLSAGRRRTIMYAACAMSADDYGYLDIAAQGVNAVFHSTWATDHMGWLLKTKPICSYVVARAYKAIGLTFGKKTIESITPSDVWQFAASEPEIYDINEIILG